MGKVTVVGGKVGMNVPCGGIIASDFAVGSSVYLNENGSPVEYLVVNQGIPSNSSLYDASCNGTWLLRKEIHSNRVWDSTDNDYANSDIHTWLNNTFFNTLGSVERTVIKTAKVTYMSGTGDNKTLMVGENSLSTKVFLLSNYEVGFTSATISDICEDGAVLEYFKDTSYHSNDPKRVAYLNGTASAWWLRISGRVTSNMLLGVTEDGVTSFARYSYGSSCGVRPALILPSTALFDEETLALKGVT